MNARITIQNIETSLSDEEITVLGISKAGWMEYVSKLENENVNVYDSINGSILDEDESVYASSHTYETREEKSSKVKDIRSIEAALGEVIILFLPKNPATMEAITNI